MLINDEDEVNDRLKELTNGEELLTTDTMNMNGHTPWLFIQSYKVLTQLVLVL